MRALIEAVETGAHVHGAVVPALVVRGRAIDGGGGGRPGVGGQGVRAGHGQIDGAAFGVIGHPGHIAQAPEVLLVHPWVELGLAWVARLGGEAPHVGDRAAGSIAVEDLQTVAFGAQSRLHPGQGLGGVDRQQAFRRRITVERVPGEVVGAGVADILRDARIDRAQVHHVFGPGFGRLAGTDEAGQGEAQ